MRQTPTRRGPDCGTRGPGKDRAKPIAAGEHLDLGMTVSVYCAEAMRRERAELGAPALNQAEGETGFTEH